jgi:uncharacterized protein (TIGR00255 family)
MAPRSMTGFGTADGDVAGGRLRLEIRSVNHRHLNVQLKVPPELSDLEGALRERLRGHFDRGHVTVAGRWLEAPAGATAVTVNLERARALVAALRRLGDELQLRGDVDLATVARLPEVVTAARDEGTPDGVAVVELLDRAAAACVAAREREGAALAAELLARLDAVAALATRVGAATPDRVVRERDRLAAAVRELTGGLAVDQSRLSQEIAYLADRLDVTEELVRLRTHEAAMRQVLSGSEPAGRRLGFLLQEMGREANTIGSKANDAVIADTVIALKTELEKLREQIENLE